MIHSIILFFVFSSILFAQNLQIHEIMNLHNMGEFREKIMSSDTLLIDSVVIGTRIITYDYNSANKIHVQNSGYLVNDNLHIIGRYTYFYNSKNSIDSIIHESEKVDQLYDILIFGNTYKYTNSFDDKENVVTKLKEYWAQEKWWYSERDSCAYDFGGNKTSLIRQYWDWENNRWRSSFRDAYTFNQTNNLETETWQYWDGNNWRNYGRILHYYDLNDNLTKKIKQEWTNNNWQNDLRETFNYDFNNVLISMISDTPSPIGWNAITKTTYSYDSNKDLILILKEAISNNTNTWENESRIVMTYYSKGNLESRSYDVWRSDHWGLSAEYFSFYDYYGNLFEFGYNKMTFYYSNPTTAVIDITSDILDFRLSQNYPNPFNPSTIINYSLPHSGLVQLKVYDLLGREVATLVNKEQTKGNYKINFNASNLTSGIYFYKLQSGDFSEMKKLILLR